MNRPRAKVSSEMKDSLLIGFPDRFTVAPSSAYEPPVESGDAVRTPRTLVRRPSAQEFQVAVVKRGDV